MGCVLTDVRRKQGFTEEINCAMYTQRIGSPWKTVVWGNVTAANVILEKMAEVDTRSLKVEMESLTHIHSTHMAQKKDGEAKRRVSKKRVT